MEEKEEYDHERFMRRCIQLATIAKQRGDIAAGSIVVQEGKIVGEGTEGGKTHKDITFHSEIEAIRYAALLLGTQDLSNCIMYTTHEPCIMCLMLYGILYKYSSFWSPYRGNRRI